VKPDDAPARAPGVVTEDFEGEVLIYHRRTGEVHRLDSIGAVVWRCLDGRTSVDELVEDLASVFGVDPGVVRSDVADLLERLEEASLLAGRPGPVPQSDPRLVTNPPSP